MRVQHVKHAPNPDKCFIFTDFVPCSYFELQQGDGVTARSVLASDNSLKIVCLLYPYSVNFGLVGTCR